MLITDYVKNMSEALIAFVNKVSQVSYAKSILTIA